MQLHASELCIHILLLETEHSILHSAYSTSQASARPASISMHAQVATGSLGSHAYPWQHTNCATAHLSHACLSGIPLKCMGASVSVSTGSLAISRSRHISRDLARSLAISPDISRSRQISRDLARSLAISPDLSRSRQISRDLFEALAARHCAA